MLYFYYLIISFITLNFFIIFSYRFININHSINTFNNIIYVFFFINIIFTMYYLFYSTLDSFSKAILGLCVCINYIVVVCLNSKIKYFIFQSIFLYSFSIVTYLLVTTNNIFILFICYEFLMIPSIILIYKSSYSAKTLSSMLYFFLWTQSGSFLVLISIIFLSNLLLPNLLIYKLNLIFIDPIILKFIKFFIFIGFGIKVPIFPFYRWLIQIHVEAPSGFSIFLSGFLVKVSLFIYYKISLLLPYSFEYIELFMIFGILNASLKFWFQTDIKKVIAYATVQEMNIIFFILNFIDQKTLYISIIFIVSHGFLSAFMFFIVELIYRRFLTRNIYMLNNLWYYTPILAKIIFLKILIFLGLPGFIKFTIELIFYMFCFSINIPICFFFFFIINIVGMVGYARVWLFILFSSDKNYFNFKIIDLTLHELLICISLIFINFFINFLLIV